MPCSLAARLGVSPTTVAALAPYATLLPDPATRLNINTAEATVLMAGIEGLDALGRQIRSPVLRCTGIPVAVGIAPTKTLANDCSVW